MEGFNTQDVANTLWAFAKLNIVSKEVIIKGLERQATARMGDFNAQEIADTLWGQ